MFGAIRPTNRIFFDGEDSPCNTAGSGGKSYAPGENSKGNTCTRFAPSAATSAALYAESAQTASASAATAPNSRRPSSSWRTTRSSNPLKNEAGVTLW